MQWVLLKPASVMSTINCCIVKTLHDIAEATAL